MDFKDLENVNKTLRTTDVKSKAYVEVNERIKGFRQLFPNGSIETNIERLENGVVVMSCTVKDENGKVLSKAYAYEKEGSTFINKTSYIENCCTSATGRALGYLGIGIDTSVASAEEVGNAQLQQEAEQVIDKIKVAALKQSIENNGLTMTQVNDILSQYDYTKLEDIKIRYFGEIVNKLKALKGE